MGAIQHATPAAAAAATATATAKTVGCDGGGAWPMVRSTSSGDNSDNFNVPAEETAATAMVVVHVVFTAHDSSEQQQLQLYECLKARAVRCTVIEHVSSWIGMHGRPALAAVRL